MEKSLAILARSGIRFYDSSISALDAYRNVKGANVRFALAECGLVDLAKAFDDIRYSGLPYADASLDLEIEEAEGATPLSVHIRCADSPGAAERAAFAPLDLLRDPRRRVYLDPKDVYGSLRSELLEARAAPAEVLLFEAAVLVSRHPYRLPADFLPAPPRDFPVEAQRDLLCLMLTGARPEAGLELLRICGFLESYWPELAHLHGVGHSKEFHPEGDAWAHTLETFRYRKHPSLRLSLALLLHDAGKARAGTVEGRRFDRHAEIGSNLAERFLRRLGFPAAIVDDATFLVRYHMMPAAMPRLPKNRMEGVIDDGRFPLLLELYKCDELSTFKGPDSYYEACAAYRAYLKNLRNPWRGADGRVLARMYLAEKAR
jgi:poly(A) polymerase